MHPLPLGRLLDALLEQGTVREEGGRLPGDLRRHGHGRRETDQPNDGTFGFVARGLKNANVPVWTSFLLGYGGDPLTRRATSSPTAPRRSRPPSSTSAPDEVAPPGVTGFNWNETSPRSSRALGMWIDGVGFAPPLEDPTESRIVGKVGYGVMPAARWARIRGPSATASASRPRARTRKPPSSMPVGGFEGAGRTPAADGLGRAVPQFGAQTRRCARA